MNAAAYCLRRFRCALGAALLISALSAASQVTAHFAYAESAVGQATAGYRGVAVDGSYNIYLTAGGGGHQVVRVAGGGRRSAMHASGVHGAGRGRLAHAGGI